MTTEPPTVQAPPALTGLMEVGAQGQSGRTAVDAVPSTRLPLVSVVIPALDEELNIGNLLGELATVLGRVEGWRFEILVVDDGSTDRTAEIASRFPGVRVHSHPTNLGNGASVKRGIRMARGDWILLMDGDGQHPPGDIPAMLAKVRHEGFDMVVGSRAGSGGALHRNLANRVYNGLASYVTSRRIPDLTSGFRLVRADALKGFVQMLPNTFSYPTTITLAMFKAGYAVHYHPIQVRKRGGRSKIRLVKDGSRFLMIIMKVATMFAPLRVFLPLAGFVFAIGLGWYLYTYLVEQRFTNMGVLLLVQSGLLFCLGLISEQIAQLRFDRTGSTTPEREGET